MHAGVIAGAKDWWCPAWAVRWPSHAWPKAKTRTIPNRPWRNGSLWNGRRGPRTRSRSAGAQILLRLEHAITTKAPRSATHLRRHDLPLRRRRPDASASRTYVQGRISAIQRPGRVKGRAELLFHFTTLIYPNGYRCCYRVQSIMFQNGAFHNENEEGTIRRTATKATM